MELVLPVDSSNSSPINTATIVAIVVAVVATLAALVMACLLVNQRRQAALKHSTSHIAAELTPAATVTTTAWTAADRE